MKQLEKHFEIKVKNYLKEKNCWFVKYWGGIMFTKSGIPDILCCCNGYFVAIELKSENGQPTKLQLHNLSKLKKNGAISLLLYPHYFNQFKRLIDCLLEFKYSDAKLLMDEINQKEVI